MKTIPPPTTQQHARTMAGFLEDFARLTPEQRALLKDPLTIAAAALKDCADLIDKLEAELSKRPVTVSGGIAPILAENIRTENLLK